MQPFKLKLITLILSCNLSIFTGICLADTEPFLPTWKNLKPNEKQLYIAGYLNGLRDTEEVVSIAAEYVEKNPALVAQTLKKVQQLCSVSDVGAGALVPEIDAYYSKLENQSAALSLALSSAQQKIRNSN